MEGAILTAIRDRLDAALAGSPLVRRGMRALRVDGIDLGYVDAGRAARLAAFDRVFRVDHDAIGFVAALGDAASRTAAIAGVARELAREGALSAWRNELYAVSELFGAAPAFLLERAAARYFGIHTFAVHVNGVVASSSGGPMLWFARRSPTKPIDPGQLDNLVGGGIAAGGGIADTVAREAWEEAGIDASLAATARPAGTLYVERLHPDGLQRETIFAHDLALPAHFVPANQDGEAIEHRLVPLAEAARLIAATTGADVVTIDASVVVFDYLLRVRRARRLPSPLSARRRGSPSR